MMNRTTVARVNTALGLALLLSAAAPAPARVDDDTTYRTATGLLNRGLHEAAAEEYRKFLREEPDDARAATARYGLAVCLARMSRPAEAAAELDQVLKDESFEFRADALLLRARCHLDAGEFEAAAARLRELRERHADSPRAAAAAALEGESLLRAGRAREARSLLQKSFDGATDGPDKVRAGYFLSLADLELADARSAAERLAGLARLSSGEEWPARLALAEAQARASLGQADDAARLYRRAITAVDAGVRRPAQLGLARLLRQAEDTDAAAQVLEPLMAEKDAAEAGPARLELARCWIDAGQPARARELLGGSAGPAGVASDETSYWLARAEAGAGDFAAAAERLVKALKADPDSPLAPNMMYDLAAALSRSGDTSRALQALETFAERHPDHALAPDAALARAALLHAEGEFEASAAACRALAKDPTPTRRAQARLLIAENAYLLNDFKAAETGYDQFLREFADDPRAWRASVRRGLSLARLDRADEARPLLEAALKDRRAAEASERSLVEAASLCLGDLAFAKEDWPVAEALYAKAGPGDGASDAVALLKLGLSIQRQGRAQDAIAVYDRLAALPGVDDGITLHATFERAQALADLSRTDEARAGFEAVIRAEQGADSPRFTPHALRRLASMASSSGRADEAAELLGRLAETSGDQQPAATLDRAAVLLSAGRAAEAEAVLRGFLKGNARHELAPRARVQLATAVARQDRAEEALELIDRLSPEDVSDDLRPTLLYERAWCLKSLARPAEAAKTYEALLRTDPPPALAAHAMLDLAQLEASANACDEALRRLDEAEKIAAALAAAERGSLAGAIGYLRGACAFRLERWEEAASKLGEFADAHPDDPTAASAHLLAGEALLKAGRAAQATARLKTASASKEDAVRGPALLRLGESLTAEERWLESEQALVAFLEAFPADELWFQARFGIGWAREQQGKHDGAIEAYREVAARHDGPTAARAQFQVGECLFAKKRYDEASTELLKVDILFSYPEWSAAALYEAGRCLQEAGKPDEARRQFTAVTDRFPDSEWAAPARDRLRGLEPAPLPGRAPAAATSNTQTRRTGR